MFFDFLKCNSALSLNKTGLTFQSGGFFELSTAIISRTKACNSAKRSRGDCLCEVHLQNRCCPRS